MAVGRCVQASAAAGMTTCESYWYLCVTKNCLSQFLEQFRIGSHSAVTNLYKNIPEHSNPYVITQTRNCAKLLYLVPNRVF